MKTKFFALIGSLALLVSALVTPVPAEAQTMVYTNNTAMTNELVTAAATTVNLGSPVDLQYHRDCGLLFRFQGDGAGTSLVTLTFARSYDGTAATLETTPRFTWAVAQNGNTAVIAYTNLAESVIGPARYLHLVSATNASAANMTNVSLAVVTKARP